MWNAVQKKNVNSILIPRAQYVYGTSGNLTRNQLRKRAENREERRVLDRKNGREKEEDSSYTHTQIHMCI